MLFLLACSPYALTLLPVVPNNQTTLFSSMTAVDITFYDSQGDASEPVHMGKPLTGNRLKQEGPELQGSYAEVVGHDAENTRGWGRSARFANDPGKPVPVLMSDSALVGWLQAEPELVYGSTLTALGNGEFWMTGGATRVKDDTRSFPVILDTIRHFSVTDPQELAFEDAGTLPPYPDPLCGGDACETFTERVGHSVTPLGGVDAGKVLVAGGSKAWNNFFQTGNYNADLNDITDNVQVLDLSTGLSEAVLHDENAVYRLQGSRAFHIAVPLPDGGVVLWGGWGNRTGSENPLVEIFSPGNRMMTTFAPSDSQAPGPLGSAGTMTQDGALICGGSSFESLHVLESLSHCLLVRGSSIETAPEMVLSRTGHAMVTLNDGRVLLSGGIDLPLTSGDFDSDIYTTVYPATAEMQILENGAWRVLDSTLDIPRAGHQMALLPDGRVLIYGGATGYSLADVPATTDDVDVSFLCASIYDPADDSVTALSGCSGTVYQPTLAADPDFGAIAVGGMTDDVNASAGVNFFSGLPPQ